MDKFSELNFKTMLKNKIKINSTPIEDFLFALNKVSKNFTSRKLFSGVDLVMQKKDRLAIVGPNGTGKSTLLKIIVGLIESDTGSVQRDKDLRIGYLPQETNWDSLENKMIIEMKSTNSEIFDLIRKKEKYESIISDSKRKDLKEKINEYGEIVNQYEARDGYKYEMAAEEILPEFDFPESEWERKVRSLSGGERTRLALAKIILQKPNLLILDEPTNHLDIESKTAIAAILKNFTGPIIMISHDRYVLNEICNIIWKIKNNEIKKYLGNYDDSVDRGLKF